MIEHCSWTAFADHQSAARPWLPIWGIQDIDQKVDQEELPDQRIQEVVETRQTQLANDH